MSKIQVSELKARFSKKQKLPVPAPNHPELSADPAIPAFLDRKQNGIKGPGPAVVVRLPVNTKPLDLPEAAAKLREDQRQVKKTRTAVRIEKLKAKQAGETKAMPLTGKAALQAIVADAIDNGKVKITKIEANINRQARKGTPAKAPGKAKGAKNGKGGSKVALIADLLKRKGGCTTADVLKATGWPSVSMPAQAKAAGLKLVKNKKKGEVTRYSA